ncbi:unnamed protein product [Moneuplotes crassus]|uniref:Uncharacterized protein n=1 Tax=Euplotes crassus TaxID=5936 RepID=A0AAD1XUD7_EUPCR|nr:unnamed protein product [Moneuplotes crassus]
MYISVTGIIAQTIHLLILIGLNYTCFCKEIIKISGESYLCLLTLYFCYLYLLYYTFRNMYVCTTLKVAKTSYEMKDLGEKGTDIVKYLSQKTNDSSTTEESKDLKFFDDWERCKTCLRYSNFYHHHTISSRIEYLNQTLLLIWDI